MAFIVRGVQAFCEKQKEACRCWSREGVLQKEIIFNLGNM